MAKIPIVTSFYSKPMTIRLNEIDGEAKALAKTLRGGEVLALVGPLGAGKTTFVKALARALRVKAPVTSPTFVLFHKLLGRLRGRPLIIYHFDLYRIRSYRELQVLGIEELWGQPHTLTVIEWADKIAHHLPKKTHILKFQ